MSTTEQKNETPQEVLLKIQKIKALAERGVGGEKTAAQKLLTALCIKYGISEEEIGVEEKREYWFHTRTSVRKIFLQVYTSMFGETERYKNEVRFYKASQGSDIKCMFTPSEYIEFSQLWEWHRMNYLAERKKMRKLFESGYVERHKLYPTEIDPEFQGKNKKMSLEEIMAIEGLAAMCENKTFRKQLGKEETPYQEEDEDED